MKRQASVGMFYLYTFIICIAIAALTSCKSTYQHCDAYGINSVDNPENEEYVNEVAFNLNIHPEEVTQVMFDARYAEGY
jgi:hypothetical protein